jgi:hypothetical protein
MTEALLTEESKIEKAIQLCLELLGEYDVWVSQYPEKAAALMEMAGLLESEIRGELIRNIQEKDLCYLSFVTADGKRACFIPRQEGYKFQMVYEEED